MSTATAPEHSATPRVWERPSSTSDRRTRPCLLVTDCGRGSALAMIRSFARQGWQVIAADAIPRNVRYASRHASGRFVYPSPQSRPDAFVDEIRRAVERWNVDLVVPITDEALLPLSRERNTLPPFCQLAAPDPAALELTTNKQKTLELAAQLGVPAPRTAVIATAVEAEQAAAGFEWPIVMKPLVSRLFRDGQTIEALTVTYAADREELLRRMQTFEGRCPVLLQEYVAGTGYGVEILAAEGRMLAAFQHKRLREVPVTGGASSLRESVPLDPPLLAHSERLLSALKWTGLAMVEFKVGANGPRLMEINGRVWGSLPLAVHSGMDFPRRLAELYLYGAPAGDQPPATSYRIGTLGRNLELDVVWILAVLRGKRRHACLPMPSRSAGLKAVLSLLNPAIRFDIQSWRDPLPGVGELLRIAQKIMTKGRGASKEPD